MQQCLLVVAMFILLYDRCRLIDRPAAFLTSAALTNIAMEALQNHFGHSMAQPVRASAKGDNHCVLKLFSRGGRRWCVFAKCCHRPGKTHPEPKPQAACGPSLHSTMAAAL